MLIFPNKGVAYPQTLPQNISQTSECPGLNFVVNNGTMLTEGNATQSSVYCVWVIRAPAGFTARLDIITIPSSSSTSANTTLRTYENSTGTPTSRRVTQAGPVSDVSTVEFVSSGATLGWEFRGIITFVREF